MLREEGITGVGLRTEGRLRQHSPRRRAVTHAQHGQARQTGRNKREVAAETPFDGVRIPVAERQRISASFSEALSPSDRRAATGCGQSYRNTQMSNYSNNEYGAAPFD